MESTSARLFSKVQVEPIPVHLFSKLQAESTPDRLLAARADGTNIRSFRRATGKGDKHDAADDRGMGQQDLGYMGYSTKGIARERRDVYRALLAH